MEAECAANGASVNLRVFDKHLEVGPRFDSDDDPCGTTRTGIVDIDVNVDGTSHVAKGFLTTS